MKKMLLPLLVVLPVAAWAQAELFDENALLIEANSLKLNMLEPASGGADAAKPHAEEAAPAAHGKAAAEEAEPVADGAVVDSLAPEPLPTEAPAKDAAEGGHEAPAAEGGHGEAKPEKKKKPAKEEAYELPKVTIGSATVVTHAALIADAVSITTPVTLKLRGMDEILERRVNIIPYAHSPSKGAMDAPIQVVLFEDLACATCLPTMAKIDAVLADYTSRTQVIHIYAPQGAERNANLAAFYAKIAQRGKKFWEFRSDIIAGNVLEPKALFDLLVKTGVSERMVRSLMMTEARRFYRELDGDVMMSRSFAVQRIPTVFINGIRVGPGGVPFEKLGDVLSYVDARIKHGLPEPGL